ncbi:hypothetical protein [Bacteroides sp.]|uniref:hypothetical protein n=1 Tax=Bacteroides sp. TaxID=29523 RepID=UPI00261E7B28|nr:hypothetical protein [Bacteroides sp.]MDD3040807.1 hypothetical protein [Bacteroides sp.]
MAQQQINAILNGILTDQDTRQECCNVLLSASAEQAEDFFQRHGCEYSGQVSREEIEQVLSENIFVWGGTYCFSKPGKWTKSKLTIDGRQQKVIINQSELAVHSQGDATFKLTSKKNQFVLRFETKQIQGTEASRSAFSGTVAFLSTRAAAVTDDISCLEDSVEQASGEQSDDWYESEGMKMTDVMVMLVGIPVLIYGLYELGNKAYVYYKHNEDPANEEYQSEYERLKKRVEDNQAIIKENLRKNQWLMEKSIAKQMAEQMRTVFNLKQQEIMNRWESVCNDLFNNWNGDAKALKRTIQRDDGSLNLEYRNRLLNEAIGNQRIFDTYQDEITRRVKTLEGNPPAEVVSAESLSKAFDMGRERIFADVEGRILKSGYLLWQVDVRESARKCEQLEGQENRLAQELEQLEQRISQLNAEVSSDPRVTEELQAKRRELREAEITREEKRREREAKRSARETEIGQMENARREVEKARAKLRFKA